MTLRLTTHWRGKIINQMVNGAIFRVEGDAFLLFLRFFVLLDKEGLRKETRLRT